MPAAGRGGSTDARTLAGALTRMSTGATSLALVLGAAALLLVPQRPRLGGTLQESARPSRGRARPARRAGWWTTVVAAVGLSLFPWWVAVPAAVIVGGLVVALPARRSAAGREQERRLITAHAELFASCLDAGMATGAALLAVSDVLSARGSADRSAPGPEPPAQPDASKVQASPLAGLDAVAAMLVLGADAATAWRAIDLDGDLAPLAAAALRSAAGGGGLAEAVREYATQLRQDIAAESVRAAGRAGVLMTAPLGVCFLPAFLCLGLAPVVVGLLGQLQIF